MEIYVSQWSAWGWQTKPALAHPLDAYTACSTTPNTKLLWGVGAPPPKLSRSVYLVWRLSGARLHSAVHYSTAAQQDCVRTEVKYIGREIKIGIGLWLHYNVLKPNELYSIEFDQQSASYIERLGIKLRREVFCARGMRVLKSTFSWITEMTEWRLYGTRNQQFHVEEHDESLSTMQLMLESRYLCVVFFLYAATCIFMN